MWLTYAPQSSPPKPFQLGTEFLRYPSISTILGRRVFFAADRKDAYKQLLLDQEYVNLTLSPLRNPASGLRYAFAPEYFCSGGSQK